MATFDNTVNTSDNFKGYTGNPPTTEAEYDALDCWVDNSLAPTWASVSADMRLEDVRLNRKAKYDLLNQDEMRYDDLINSTTTWQDAIAAIKTEYPK